VTQPTPAIVAQSAVRALPRPALWLLCLAYVLPGFVARDPWRMADMEAFGYMRALAFEGGDWLRPLLAGLPAPDGLLPYWLGALALRAAPAWLDGEIAARLPFMALLALALAATWCAVRQLARLPGAGPVAFAFGGEASSGDYARALADGGLLALLACLGLAQLAHETSAQVLQLGAVALLFCASARLRTSAHMASDTRAALAAGTALAALTLGGAPALACVLGSGCAALVWFCAPQTEDGRACHRTQTLLWLAASAAMALLACWLDLWRWRVIGMAEGGSFRGWASMARLLLWFGWPAWPLALWTLWVWRRQIGALRQHPHLALPLFFATAALLHTLLAPQPDRALLLGLPALAALAALALPALRRTLSAVIDWFTLLFFSTAALIIWIIWLSLQTGVPAKPAANVARLAPDFAAHFSPLAFAVAALATLAWCALVAWRGARYRAALWKSLVLPAGGATLCWLLLMTLWLPPLNHARSFAPHMQRVLALLPADAPCLYTYELPRAHIAALRYYGAPPIVRWPPAPGASTRCDWMIATQERWQQDGTEDETTPAASARPPWRVAARIMRPGDRRDFLLLLRRASNAHELLEKR